jgi:hypothetical protein
MEAGKAGDGYLEVPVVVDLSGTGEALGSFDGHLTWDAKVLKLVNISGGDTPGFTHPTLNTDLAEKGKVAFAHAYPLGARGEVHILTARFAYLTEEKGPNLRLDMEAMHAAQTFTALHPEGSPGSVSENKPVALSAFPNPFQSMMQISYELPEEDNIELQVFDQSGRRMATLVQGQVAAGSHRIQWDGTNTQGKQLPNGVYYLRLQTSQHVSQYRVILAK